MKKIMFGLGAALALVACADIESSNVVGYTTKEAEMGKFMILGTQFEDMTGGMDINSLLGGIVGGAYDDAHAFTKTAPQIQIPSGGAYKTYYYLQDGWDEVTESEIPGWSDYDGFIVKDTFVPGVAVWFKSVQQDATPTVAGQVPVDDEVSIECPEIFSLRTYAFPAAVNINSEKMQCVGIVGGTYDDAHAFTKTAPQIQIPSGGAYKTYYYLQDGWDEATESEVPGWSDYDGFIVKDEVIPAAQGFWVKGVTGAFTLKFTK